MSYRIDYPKSIRKERINVRLPILTVICFLLFLFLVNLYWPEGAAQIQTILLAVKDSTAVSALECFAGELVAGEKVMQAFSDFFQVLVS